jgi:4a-hydroxytetrahydrobiopterin dehydratase
MIERITAQMFRNADGVGDWRVGSDAAATRFNTGSFATGVTLLNAIAVLSETADHHPDIDLRYTWVGVRLTTHHVKGLSVRDIELARKISAVAREMDVHADPTAEEPAGPE